MFVLTTIWALLILAAIVLVIMKKRIAGFDDETLHVSDSALDEDTSPAHRRSVELINRFDQWTLGLNIAIVVYTVLLLIRYLYLAWQQGPNFNL